MGEVVNLRLARKVKARVDRQATADANRVLHGRTKAEREALKRERARAERSLDGARLQSDD